jgi:SpoIIAA-like
VNIAMLFRRVFEPPDLLVATITEVLTSADQAALVEWVRESIRTAGTVRVLIRLERFAGWSPIGAVDDNRLWLRDDERVSRMAVVGDAKWKLPMLTMTAQPLRRMAIAFFETEAAARTWLNAEATEDALST